MPQFDVYRIVGHGLVVDCQNNVLDDLRSRVVAPLRQPEEPTVSQSRLNPLVTVNEINYRVAIQFLRAVDGKQLTSKVGSLVAHEYDIKAAIDMLVSGY